ncbi:MAG: hypothetical protein ACI83D_000054 [Planctomycetota bacterium]|jgi:hypothetical protein
MKKNILLFACFLLLLTVSTEAQWNPGWTTDLIHIERSGQTITAQMDPDSVLDIIVTSQLYGVHIYRGPVSNNSGEITIISRNDWTEDTDIYSRKSLVHDYTGDGVPDIATLWKKPGTEKDTVTIWEQLPDDQFKLKVKLAVGNVDGFITFEEGGLATYSNDTVTIYPNIAADPNTYFVYAIAAVRDIATADIGQNGTMDIVVYSQDSSQEALITTILDPIGNKTIVHDLSIIPQGISPMYQIQVADMNNDGFSDIIGTNIGGDIVLIEGKGEGLYSSTSSYTYGPVWTNVGNALSNVLVEDVDGNGLPDIITTYSSTTGTPPNSIASGYTVIAKNMGNFLFDTHELSNNGGNSGVVVLDVNSDGCKELVVRTWHNYLYFDCEIMISTTQPVKKESAIYPNPAKGGQVVQLPEPSEYEIYSMEGRLLSSGTGRKIEISDQIPPGMYLVRITPGNKKERYTTRMIIN